MANYQLFRVVVAAVIYNEDKKKFLLAKRHAKDEHQPGVWAIPAGHIEASESTLNTLEQNLIREVYEEIGVKIDNLVYFDSHSWIDPEFKKITCVYLAKIAAGEPSPEDETDEIQWLDQDEVTDLNLAPHIQRLINKAAVKLGWKNE